LFLYYYHTAGAYPAAPSFSTINIMEVIREFFPNKTWYRKDAERLALFAA